MTSSIDATIALGDSAEAGGALLRLAATITPTIDPAQPGRVYHHITGPTAETVQAEVDRLMAEVEEGTGYATFDRPRRCAGGFETRGFTHIMEG